MLRTVTILIFCITIYSYSSAQEKKEIDESRYKGINTGNETRILESKLNNKDYKLYISLPKNYDEDINLSYPVLYILDAQWDFTSMVSSQKFLNSDRLIPELIVVGISYAGENPNYSSLRTNDLTPTVIPERKNSGNAKLFASVLRTEIIPFVEREYRASDNRRTLAGNSFGGLFTNYMLFHYTDTFDNYIICNPSFWYDRELSYTFEENYFKDNKKLNANVILISGSLDDVERHDKMAKQIESRKYAGLNFKFSVVEGFAHSSTKSIAYAKGVLHSYKITPIKLDEKKLLKYTGNYELAPGKSISITINNGHLAIEEFDGFVNIPIYAVAEGEFSIWGTYIPFDFNKNDDGDITGLSTEYNDVPITLKKIK